MEFQANEIKELNVALKPLVTGTPLTVTKIFICPVSSLDDPESEDTLYLGVRNDSPTALAVHCHVYEWGAYYPSPTEQYWALAEVTIPAGGEHLFRTYGAHLKNYTVYYRVELLVNDVVVVSIPKIYFTAGKVYIGGEAIAVGQCTYKAPGMVVLWYSQRSYCNSWRGNYHYPQIQPYEYSKPIKLSIQDGNRYPAVFIPIWDERFLSVGSWQAYISGGGSGSAHRGVHFNFTTS
jgi:hypothetical protein